MSESPAWDSVAGLKGKDRRALELFQPRLQGPQRSTHSRGGALGSGACETLNQGGEAVRPGGPREGFFLRVAEVSDLAPYSVLPPSHGLVRPVIPTRVLQQLGGPVRSL